MNESRTNQINARVELPDANRLVVATPDEPEAVAAPAEIRVLARSAAVVMEE